MVRQVNESTLYSHGRNQEEGLKNGDTFLKVQTDKEEGVKECKEGWGGKGNSRDSSVNRDYSRSRVQRKQELPKRNYDETVKKEGRWNYEL